MNIALSSYRLVNQVTSLIAPSWTAKKLLLKFLTPRHSKIKAWEVKAEEKGTRFNLSDDISAIRWLPNDASDLNGTEGSESKPSKKVLLVHGWESRATQMYGFVPQLLKQGYEVVALDMPAHGSSSGSTTNPYEFSQTVLLAESILGSFEVIIGHSMGAGAANIAITQGLASQKLVLISGPSSIENVLRRFARFLGLNNNAVNFFIKHAGDLIGFKAEDIDLITVQKRTEIPTLFIHDRMDYEVPIIESERMLPVFTNSEFLVTEGLGHRQILKSELVLNKIEEFIMGDELPVSNKAC